MIRSELDTEGKKRTLRDGERIMLFLSKISTHQCCFEHLSSSSSSLSRYVFCV